ncbi:HTH-type transcriptional regulator CynR, partial [Haemophilus influenzae]
MPNGRGSPVKSF